MSVVSSLAFNCVAQPFDASVRTTAPPWASRGAVANSLNNLATASEKDWVSWAADPTTTVEKTLVKDLVPYLEAPGGLLYEKIEGMALMDDGNVYVCNDNDGVDDNSGETQLLNVGGIL